MKDFETIAGISTPLVSGAISIVRMSGKDSVKIADKFFATKKGKKPSSFTPRMLTLGEFKTDAFSEQCLLVVFSAPNSFTGEDMVEIQCHGGVMIAKGILSTLLRGGAKMASAGEFSKRAFLNGKMSLSNAEGMMDMINATSEAEIRAGYSLLKGELSKKAADAQQKLVDILSDIEVSLDYPEEDIEYTTKEKTKSALLQIQADLEKQLASRGAGKLIKEGVKVAILGKPNVGKSSLLNALLKDEKAIVTSVAGTTRDIIEGEIAINGLKFILFDTAGIRDTQDEIEKIGVEKAKNLILSADIILLVKEDEKESDQELGELLKNKKVITVLNKADKTNNYSSGENIIRLSAKENKNLEKLTEKLYQVATEGQLFGDNVILTSERHYNALLRAYENIKNALSQIDNYSIDVITIDLNLAYQAFGEITGNTSSEEIVNAIFSKFCLGK